MDATSCCISNFHCHQLSRNATLSLSLSLPYYSHHTRQQSHVTWHRCSWPQNITSYQWSHFLTLSASHLIYLCYNILCHIILSSQATTCHMAKMLLVTRHHIFWHQHHSSLLLSQHIVAHQSFHNSQLCHIIISTKVCHMPMLLITRHPLISHFLTSITPLYLLLSQHNVSHQSFHKRCIPSTVVTSYHITQQSCQHPAKCSFDFWQRLISHQIYRCHNTWRHIILSTIVSQVVIINFISEVKWK